MFLSHIDVSLLLFLPPFLSLKSISMSSGENKRNKYKFKKLKAHVFSRKNGLVFTLAKTPEGVFPLLVIWVG